MNLLLKIKTTKTLSHIPSCNFSYGPFKVATFNSSFCEHLVDKRILRENVIESFKLTYKHFLEALMNKEYSTIEKLTTKKFQSYFHSNFIEKYLSDNDVKMKLENHNDYSLTIENLKTYNVIYGLDIKNHQAISENIYSEVNLIPGTFLKKILFFNIKTKLFVPPILVVDVIFTTNLKPIFVKNGKTLFKSQQNSMENYLWQFICMQKFKNYDVPFVINEREMKKFFDFQKIKNNENLNLVSLFESRQKQYENFGWKINDINNFIPTNHKFIVF